MRSTLSSHSADASAFTFRRPNFFSICTNFFDTNVAVYFKCIVKHGGTSHSQQRASNGVSPEIATESFSLLRERAPSAPGVDFKTLRPIIKSSAPPARPSACGGEFFWYNKLFCSFQSLCLVISSLRSNGKVSFDGGGGAQN